jgi:16S rRNA processing protein RimM
LKERLRVGLVSRAHGIDGAVRVQALTDYPERFKKGACVDADGRRLTVAESSADGEQFTVRFAEVPDRSAAEALVGSYLTLPLEDARPLPEGSYYHFQLVGLRVLEPGGRELGRVEEVLEYPTNDVLRVVKAGAPEVLIPMLRSVVRSIDPAAGQMLVELPEEVES